MSQATRHRSTKRPSSDQPAGKKWYVVHTYSGYEHKAKAALEERVRALECTISERDAQGNSAKCWCRSKRVQELGKGGQRKISSRKFFPGYIFVNMELTTKPGT